MAMFFFVIGLELKREILVCELSDPKNAILSIVAAIGVGLVLGKLIGIAGFSWLAVKFGFTTLPKGLNFKHIVGVALMGGIGFTMSIFIAELGFAHSADDLLMAKTGVLFALLIAGVSGFLWLYFTAEK